ncbi:hypothetical protein NEOLEDRAFT_1174679 [Neolentinus lepideus HHB14362 ss-1]|uniref:cAMP-independent regulatory protein pac2 n=1 Tax=Neolentinus lepideus HHB14362 ss-1 TaxID=1314782 RepID=A0A165VGT5_9AGAM|nr:hypothetical protein NEOLEDRAFT_1174679 [Neolentinus lepideus HHB14362 ss-1]
MQQPTLKNTRVRSVEDVHKICYAAYLGKLPIITRRLDTDERSALGPGDVYVWEERNSLNDISGLGIVRWTEGKKWSPSRVVGDFLYYYEKAPEGAHSGDLLARQTYSTTINAPEPRGPFKICLCTYHSKNTVDGLSTIDEMPELKDLKVPEGMFVRQRKSSRKAGEVSFEDPDAPSPTHKRSYESKRRHSVSHTYAPYPARSPSFHSYTPERGQDRPRVASTSSTAYDASASLTYQLYRPIPGASNVVGSPASFPVLVHADPDNSPSTANYAAAFSVPMYTTVAFSNHEVAFPSSGYYTTQPLYGPGYIPNDLHPGSTPVPRRANSLPFDQPRSRWPSLSPNGSRSRSHSSNGSEQALALAPLEALRNGTVYGRDPADDRLLRLISTENLSLRSRKE